MHVTCIAIAICICYSDNVRVRRTTSEKLKHKPTFSAYRQYSREIYNRYKLLIPKLNDLQIQKRKVKLVYDKLCIDGKPYEFTPHQASPPHMPGQSIKSKMLNPNFELLIKKNDILIFAEIKTVEFDHLPDEYTFLAKHRKKVNRKSGGNFIIFKKYLSTNMNIVQSESEYVWWI